MRMKVCFGNPQSPGLSHQMVGNILQLLSFLLFSCNFHFFLHFHQLSRQRLMCRAWERAGSEPDLVPSSSTPPPLQQVRAACEQSITALPATHSPPPPPHQPPNPGSPWLVDGFLNIGRISSLSRQCCTPAACKLLACQRMHKRKHECM